DLEERHLALRGTAHHLADPVVPVDPLGEVHRGHGHTGAHRLDGGVAPDDPLRLVTASGAASASARLRLLLCFLRPFVRLVVRAVIGSRSGASALQPSPGPSAGSRGRVSARATAYGAAPAAVTGHCHTPVGSSRTGCGSKPHSKVLAAHVGGAACVRREAERTATAAEAPGDFGFPRRI